MRHAIKILHHYINKVPRIEGWEIHFDFGPKGPYPCQSFVRCVVSDIFTNSLTKALLLRQIFKIVFCFATDIWQSVLQPTTPLIYWSSFNLILPNHQCLWLRLHAPQVANNCDIRTFNTIECKPLRAWCRLLTTPKPRFATPAYLLHFISQSSRKLHLFHTFAWFKT